MAPSVILFLTFSELGQATVSLAVAHEFLIRSYDVHIGSFAPLEPAVSKLNVRAAYLSSVRNRTTFHPITGPPMVEANTWFDIRTDSFHVHNVGFRAALDTYKHTLPAVATPWDGPQYMAIYQDCCTLIRTLQPAIVVLDPLFLQAVDACRMLEQRYVALSPNTFKELTIQPRLASLWKHPIMCSGFPYPLPWYLILPNAYLALRLILTLLGNPRARELAEYRDAHGLSSITSAHIPQQLNKDKTVVLLPARQETEIPCYFPDSFTLCGPILRPCAPIAEEDPELASWLGRRPTVLVNLGSHVTYTIDVLKELMVGFRMLLDRRPGVQILWKIKPSPGTVLEDITLPDDLRTAVAEGQVRVEPWLAVEPICILTSDHVECMVHHGGSNSYHEAIRAGVPQVIIPVWLDTYDFALRAEWLGIGIWASRKTAPGVNGPELGQALIRVLSVFFHCAPDNGHIALLQPVNSIATGKASRGMSRNIALKGPQTAPIILYNRTTSRATAFAESIGSNKATVATTIPEAVQQATIAFICVGDDQALDQIINTIVSDSSLDLTSKLIVDCSTVHPNTSRRIHATLLERGATFIACPVFGAPNMADAGQMIVVPAGKQEAIDRLQPFFEGVTAKATLPLPGDDVGRASQLKILGNTFILNTVETVAEGLVLAEKSGLGADMYQKWIHTWLGGPFAKYADRMVEGDYHKRDEPLFAVDLARKDLGHATSIAQEAGVRLRSVEVTDAYLQEVKKEKGVKGDVAGVYGAIRKESGLEYDN
ncbi:UDP-glucoronosyl and UDP-glucosyl transferase family protein [Aspergillus bombycis]|uniref:UDP-glucoronosyl and UDP-glucosyl transferase family protein n=1 Tax=Aspergillus bombycis TaxID=109264 RepID=A0A1F7ZJI4_9EURO|nr:UDP-glucoronosyl and UDP-glucosyl transferase family protein [Aspergillus bombycis]OGM39469.1 UDP-glucoronosyl and UDP-glucosyl transferase family protein [Aspergillus bombycis]